MLDRIHPGLGADAGAVQDGGVGRDCAPAGVHGFAGAADVVHGKGTLIGTVRRIEHDLDEVGTRIQLGQRRRLEPRAVLDGDRHRQISVLGDPGTGDPDIGRAGRCRHLLRNQQADRSTVRPGGRPDVASPEHAGLDQAGRVVARHLAKPLGRIRPAIDPVAATRHRQMTVSVHEGRHDRGATAVEDIGIISFSLVG